MPFTALHKEASICFNNYPGFPVVPMSWMLYDSSKTKQS